MKWKRIKQILTEQGITDDVEVRLDNLRIDDQSVVMSMSYGPIVDPYGCRPTPTPGSSDNPLHIKKVEDTPQ